MCLLSEIKKIKKRFAILVISPALPINCSPQEYARNHLQEPRLQPYKAALTHHIP